MEILGDFHNKEPKIMSIFAVVFLDRNYGRDTFYGYFETKEKAEMWLNKQGKKYNRTLEVVQIVIS